MDIVTYALCKKNDAAIIDMITSMERLTMVVSDTVPTVATAEPNKLYLVDTNHDGIYEEYVLAEIDSVQQIVMLGDITDLSGYYTSSQVDTLLNGKEDYIQVLTQQEYDALTPAQKAEDKAYIVIIDNTHAEVYKQNRLFGTTKADHITYDHTVSGLSATDVKSAIDEVNTDVQKQHVELTQSQYDALQNPDPNTEYFITNADASGDFSSIEDRMTAIEDEYTIVYMDGNVRIPLYTRNVYKVVRVDGNTVEWYIAEPTSQRNFKATVTATGSAGTRTNPTVTVTEIV